jgi:hypothetical protein
MHREIQRLSRPQATAFSGASLAPSPRRVGSGSFGSQSGIPCRLRTWGAEMRPLSLLPLISAGPNFRTKGEQPFGAPGRTSTILPPPPPKRCYDWGGGGGTATTGGLTFHHATQEPSGPSFRPRHGRSPSSAWVVFSWGRGSRRLQRCPRGGGRVGAQLALPLLQRCLALLLHHPPATGRRHLCGSSSASVGWATGPEPWRGPRLQARAPRASSPPPQPFPLPLRRGPNARMRRAAAPAQALCQPPLQPKLGKRKPQRKTKPQSLAGS